MEGEARIVDDAAPVRQPEREMFEADVGIGGGFERDFWRPLAQRLGARNGSIEQRQPVEDGFEARKRGVIGNEEGKRGLDPAERARRLGHDPQRYASGEIERRRKYEGNDRRDLTIKLSERDQLLSRVDEIEIVHDDRGEAPGKGDLLRRLALQERHLFAVFAQPREREAEISFDALLVKENLHQRPADQMRDQRPQSGIDQSNPEKESRHANVGAWQAEISR